MLQFLPIVTNLIGSLFAPKVQQPQMPSTGMDISQGGFIPGTMPMAPQAQTGFNWSNLLGGVLSIALGGGGTSPMMSMGAMGGMGGGMGMGNPFAMSSMLGGLGGMFPQSAMMGGMGQMYPKTMASQDMIVDALNGVGKSDVADANINILDSVT